MKIELFLEILNGLLGSWLLGNIMVCNWMDIFLFCCVAYLLYRLINEFVYVCLFDLVFVLICVFDSIVWYDYLLGMLLLFVWWFGLFGFEYLWFVLINWVFILDLLMYCIEFVLNEFLIGVWVLMRNEVNLLFWFNFVLWFYLLFVVW